MPTAAHIEVLALHYSLREPEAQRLLELAGHEPQPFDLELDAANLDLGILSKDMEMLFAPVFYTDMVNVAVTDFGITINFIQSGSENEKPVIVSRVGMSHEHAQSIVTVIKEALKESSRKKSGDKSSEE